MKKNLTSTALLILITGIYLLIFTYFRIRHFNLLGFNNNEFTVFELLKRPTILTICTMLGIFSKMLFDEIYKKENSGKKFSDIYPNIFSIKNTWLAIILCPIVVIAFNNSIQNIDSDSIVALIAYQNGFFFKSITEK